MTKFYIENDQTSSKVLENNSDFEKMYYSIFKNAPDAIMILDRRGEIKKVNDTALRVLGYSNKEMIGKSFLKLNFIPEREHPEITKLFYSMLKKESFETFQVEYIKKNGDLCCVEVNVGPINIDEKKIGFLAIIRDITKLIERAQRSVMNGNLIRSEEKWRTLFELAPDGIMTMNLRGSITSVNKAFLNLTGYSEDEIVGKHFTKIGTLRLKDIPKYLSLFSSLLRGKRVEPVEFIYKDKDGNDKYGESVARLVKVSNNKREILIITRDTSKSKNYEKELETLVNELKRSNQELDDYTFAVSHDLKAPLRTIESFGNFLLEDYEKEIDEEGKSYLNRMIDASKRMKNLIDDLLVISRVGRKFTEIESVNLNVVITEISEDISPELNKINGQIICDDLPILPTQKIWIKQLFSNLISNGLKFNKSPNPTVWVDYEERSNDYLFSVKDNGIGIDSKYYDQIFRIFQRLHSSEEYPGTGAGLTICKKIIDSFGGKIWIESKLGKGTTFYFTFPKELIEESIDENEIQSLIDQAVKKDSEELINVVDAGEGDI